LKMSWLLPEAEFLYLASREARRLS